jgi:hypothetical protein
VQLQVEANSRRFFSYGLFLPYIQVFSKLIYILIAGTTAAVFWILFSVFDQLLFFKPIFVFYVPPDAVAGFLISTINSILLGVVVSMNVYILRNTRFKFSKSLLSGSSLSVISSACVSCSSFGFLLASTFGASVLLSNFLSNYQIPLRLLSLAILLAAIYFAQKRIKASCSIN